MVAEIVEPPTSVSARRARPKPKDRAVVSPTTEPSRDAQPSAPGDAAERPQPLSALLEYQRDFWERTILFLDTLRQRADNMLEHGRTGMPAVLKFKHETLVDARTFQRPVNYALLRIVEAEGNRADECIDKNKPPVIVVDPRAGHGPGIGGFKRESEVGMALREGHPTYFVIFYPEPCRGQTLADVLHALRRFAEEVAARHPGKPPILYGNCQAGWAVTLLSADCEGLAGPTVLNGSPLSYWEGEPGMNPMRISGGLLGGAWIAHFLADVGGGQFDGAWLVQNFENLKPGNVIWDKYVDLFAKIDTERERFLDFERWWTGFHSLSREEIVAIVENLFIGNELEEGRFRICEGCYADLRRIRNPLIIFASFGDNITPPHQALGWIPTVYKDTDDLKRAGQRIVYLLNPHVGHLGIFVSAQVARLEHRAILESLDEIQALAPGLYEMKIDNPTGDPDCHKPHYAVRFEERKVKDVRFEYPRKAFERVREISEINETFYSSFVSPWISMASNPWSAAMLKWLHPMRTSRYLLSDAFSPFMSGVAVLARMVDQNRHPLDDANPFIVQERELEKAVSKQFELARKSRDDACEYVFSMIFGR